MQRLKNDLQNNFGGLQFSAVKETHFREGSPLRINSLAQDPEFVSELRLNFTHILLSFRITQSLFPSLRYFPRHDLLLQDEELKAGLSAKWEHFPSAFPLWTSAVGAWNELPKQENCLSSFSIVSFHTTVTGFSSHFCPSWLVAFLIFTHLCWSFVFFLYYTELHILLPCIIDKAKEGAADTVETCLNASCKPTLGQIQYNQTHFICNTF